MHFEVVETKVCLRCNQVRTCRLKPVYSLCGTDGIDRVNCWQNCWECSAINVCPLCTFFCTKCRGQTCKVCADEHKYKPIYEVHTCKTCSREKRLALYQNVCGFTEGEPYWICIETDGTFECIECHNKRLDESDQQ